MMISTKGRYALRVMIDIAENQRDGYIPLKEIAAAAGNFGKIPGGHRQRVWSRRSYLTGLRGKSGGYRLTKRARGIHGGRIFCA